MTQLLGSARTGTSGDVTCAPAVVTAVFRDPAGNPSFTAASRTPVPGGFPV